MNISLNAFRINQNDTTVYMSFSQITNNELKCIDFKTITNSKGEIGVIFHIQNSTKDVITSGRDSVSFKANIEIEMDVIRVFYWNDSDPLFDNLNCFEDFLEKYGLDEKAPVGDFDCTKSKNKAMLIPRQASNGGVLGIINLP